MDIGLDAMNADVNLPIMTHRNKRQKHGTGGQVSRMSDDLISRKAAEQQLMDSFLRWEYIYTHGCSDPFYEDGYNINLVRNHIIYGKRKLEELGYLPEIYGRETHPEVDNKYMARADEIRQHARQTLARYKADENLRYLIKNAHKASREEAKQISLNRVLRYAYGLEDFIKTDSLVDMRRHENPERYLESFKSCREELQRILEKPGNQEMTLITEEQTGQLRFV